MTMTAKERDSFLRQRTAVGASEVAAVMGLSKWATPQDVYTRIVMLLDHGEIDAGDPANGDLMRGILMEPVAVTMYEEQTGRKTRRVTKADEVEGKPYIRSNPDRIILSDGGETRTELLEVKCPRSSNVKKWREEGLSTEALVQVHAQLLCRPRVESAVVWVFDSQDPLQSFAVPVERDHAYEAQIDKALSHIWWEYVVPRKMPNIVPDHPAPPEVVREMVKLDPEDPVSHAIKQYAAFGDVEKEAKEEKSKWRRVIEDAAIAHQCKKLDGGAYRASVSWVAGRPRYDWNRLKLFVLEHGAHLDDFKVEGAPYTLVRTSGGEG